MAAASEVSTHPDEAGLPVDFWRRTGDQEPWVALSRGRRVVVTEFDVEFVDVQFQPPARHQPIYKPVVTLSPVHLGLELIGLWRRCSVLAEEQQQVLASQLYDVFLRDLRQRGLNLVSQDDLLATPGYAELRKMSVVKSSPLMFINALGSDTGVPYHTRTIAAPGLSVQQGTSCDRETADTRILQETRADVAVAVKLRVGTFRERPALEHRSVIRLTTCEGSTKLRACHSLVSDLVVVDTTRFRPIVGRIEPIDPAMFSSELTAMLPKFIALALLESKS